MEHKIEIVYDPAFIARGYSAQCPCGFRSANPTKPEAEESGKHHLYWEQQKEELRQRGYLKEPTK